MYRDWTVESSIEFLQFISKQVNKMYDIKHTAAQRAVEACEVHWSGFVRN